jgi:nicotinamidase-related amidase
MKIEERIKEIKNETGGLGLILVDAQESLLKGIQKKDELISALLVLLKSAKLFNLPLFVTEQVPDKLGLTAEILMPFLLDTNRIAKSSFSIFGVDELKRDLIDNDLTHLLIAGIETPICIYLSAIDARKAGYEVTILPDCVGSRRTEDESVVLDKLEKAGCHILPLESFLYGYMGTAEHSNFRQISKLVRER